MQKKILIIGGAGYVGTELCNMLVKNQKYKITCLDNFWFGDNVSKKVKKIKRDIRQLKDKDFNDYHTVIHLAYLSNDPLCELNGRDAWECGPLALYSILEKCKKSSVKHFIFASSGSVYGVKKEKKVTEQLSLKPISDYNKSKMICEKVIECYEKDFKTTIVRPATVCGFSKRLRLDVVLNLFCYQSFFKKKITIFGGNQIRPLLHIKDMISVYDFILRKEITGTYNVGFENLSIKKIAYKILKYNKSKIEFKSSNDPRSYRMNSDKIINKGFRPKYNYKDCITDLIREFENGFKPSDINWNLKWLLKKGYVKNT